MFHSLTDFYERLMLIAGGPKVLFASTSGRSVVVKTIMEVVVSLTVIAITLPSIFSTQVDPEAKKYFSGLLGSIIGYWLR